MSFSESVTASDHAEHRTREAFECPSCGYRGTLVIEALAVVTRTAKVPDPSRLVHLQHLDSRGELDSMRRSELRSLERSQSMAASPGGLQQGLQQQASAGAPRAAVQRARWLADTARCPRCNKTRAARVRPHIRAELNARWFSIPTTGFAAGLVMTVLPVLLGEVRDDGSVFRPRVAIPAVLIAMLIAVAVQVYIVRSRLQQPFADERRFEDAV